MDRLGPGYELGVRRQLLEPATGNLTQQPQRIGLHPPHVVGSMVANRSFVGLSHDQRRLCARSLRQRNCSGRTT